jgi:transmembrane sensor
MNGMSGMKDEQPAAAPPSLDAALDQQREQLKALFPLEELALTRRPATRRLAGASAAVLALCAGLAWWVDPGLSECAYVSPVGERRTLALADGSELILDADSALSVAWHLRSRRVQLQQGRARFSVAPSAWRPFSVDAGSTRVTVLGTVFDVDRQAQRVAVSVLRGRVEVAAPAEPGLYKVLTAGQGLIAQSSGGVLRWTAAAELGNAQAWTQGQLVFRRTPLREAVAQLQRYRSGAIRLQGAEVEQLQISGVFDARHSEQLLGLLPQILPLRLLQRADGSVDVLMR